jgi:glycogen synthase
MTADTVGGVWTYAMELVRAFSDNGIDVALATMGSPLTLDQAREASRVVNVEVFESNFKLEWMQKPWQDVDDAGNWLLYLEQLLEPDIIHLNGYVHAALPWKAPTVVVAHSCVMSWWNAVKGEEAPESWDTYWARVSKGLFAADVVVAPTFAMLSMVESGYGKLKNKRVIYNGRTAPVISRAKRENIVLSAGRLWDEAKNSAALAGIASGVSWPIYVAGEQAAVKGAAAGTQLPGNLHSLGRLTSEQLADWYSRAAIYALPAKYEPFGLTALEAGLSGCALVLGDIGSLYEIWKDAAVFVPPDDHQSISRAVNGLIDNEDLRSEMARRARARAEEFTPRRMSESYLELYSELLHSRIPQERQKQEASVCV